MEKQKHSEGKKQSQERPNEQNVLRKEFYVSIDTIEPNVYLQFRVILYN